MTKDLADELERLAKEATPGPWDRDRGVEKRDANACAIITAPDGSTLFDTINGGNVLIVDPDFDGGWRDETGDANAALIVALRNALPVILSALRREECGKAERGKVYVTVSGRTGTGKSAVLGEIEIAMRALGLTVETDRALQSEKNMTGADWLTALELYKPVVVLREVNVPPPPKGTDHE